MSHHKPTYSRVVKRSEKIAKTLFVLGLALLLALILNGVIG